LSMTLNDSPIIVATIKVYLLIMLILSLQVNSG
jgi:hypothetical protein